MRSLFLNILFLIPGILSLPPALLGQWTATSGPYGGSINTILHRGDTVFVGAEGGGVFYSTDNAGSWVRSNLGIAVGHVNHLLDHGDQIYAATDFGVLASDDEGISWERIAPDLPVAKATALGKIGRFVLVGIEGHGLYRSEESGTGWKLLNTLGQTDAIRAMVTADSLLFLGTRAGCYVSADSGSSWTLIPNAPRNIRSFVAKDSTILAGTTQSLFRSDDYGATWDRSSNGLEEGGVFALTVSGQKFYAGTETGIYQYVSSSDFWHKINNGLNDFRVNCLATFDDILLAGTEGSIYRSFDGGAFWEQSDNGLAATRVRGLATRSGYVFAGTKASGVFRTSDGGQEWDPVNEGLPVRRISSLVNTTDFLLAGTLGGGVQRSADNGETWEAGLQNTTHLNINILLAIGTGVFAGADTGIYFSGDQGDTWAPRGLGTGVDTMNIRALVASGTYVFAGTDGDGLFRSSDDGESWEPIDTLQLTDKSIACLRVSSPNLFAGTRSQGIFRSSDDGEHWEPINNGMPDTNVSAILATNGRLFLGTLGHGAYVSTDAGDSWELWNEGLQNPELISLLLVGSTIYGGTTGWGVESRPIPPGIPQLSSPADKAVNIPLPFDLSWMTTSGSSSYDLEICLSGIFDTLAVDENEILSTTHAMNDLARNATYYWRVRGSGPGGKGIFSQTRSFTTVATMQFVNETIHGFPEAPSASTDYRLISIPGTSPPSFAEVMPGRHEADWNIFHDTGVESDDHLIGIHPDSLFGVGKGYWAIAKGTLAFSGSVEMPPVAADGVSHIALQSGWNIIANPFDRPVTVDAIRAANMDPSMSFWTYQGTESFVDTTILHPFEGYYFKNLNGLEQLTIPYPFPVSRFATLPSPPIEWKIQVILETIAGVDRQNYAGISPAALSGIDGMDRPKPVPIGTGPYLSFVSAQANQVLGSDFRPELGEGQVWEFDVFNPSEGEATLRFPHDNVPKGLQALLVNVDENQTIDVLSDSVYPYLSTRRMMRFKLIVGPGSFVESVLENALPDQFALSQNYPNPFNPETAFHLDVPHESEVRVSIYSMLGEEIDLITSDMHAAGRYTYVWKGTNMAGMSVASGVYFVRVIVDGNPMFLRKMLLLR